MATSTPRKTSEATTHGRRTIAGWRANALQLQLTSDDLDLLENVITVVPILRIVVAIGREARKRGLTYPVSGVSGLQACLGTDRIILAGHRIDNDTIASVMPEGWFPIAHEGELLSRVHLALLRCEMEAYQLTPRPAFQPR